MFGFIRLVLGGLLWFFTTFRIKSSKLVFKRNYCIIKAVIIAVLITLAAFVPLENAFITFNSPEAAYRYYNIGTEEIELVVSGQHSDLVIGKKNHSDVYLIVPKTANGWKLGLGIDTKKLSQTVIDTAVVSLYQYKNSNDYFLVILDTSGETLSISDSNNSDFLSLTSENHALNTTFYSYYCSISNFNEGYWLRINGKILRVQSDGSLGHGDGLGGGESALLSPQKKTK